jgi:tetratricopeptide (TPR) repeat protein
MKISIALLAVAALSSQALAETAKENRIPFGSGCDVARVEIKEALSLLDNLAPPQRVRAAAERAVAANEGIAIAHLLLGNTYWGKEGQAHVDRATALAAKAPEAERLYIEAMLLQRARKNDEALAAFEKLKTAWPGEPLVWIALADAYHNVGKFDEARKAAETALTFNPQSPRANIVLANSLLSLEQYAAARAAYEKAAANPSAGASPGIWFGLATTHLYEKKPAAAVQALSGFFDKYRKDPIAGLPEVFIWNATARIQLEGGDARTALVTYQKGFESLKGAELPERQKKIWEGRLHHGQGRALAKQGKHKQAWAEAEIVKKMIDEGGEDGKEFLPAYHYLAGYLKLEAGQVPAAIEHLKQAENDDPFHLLLLARAYEKGGQKENAKAEYQKIVNTKRNSLERAFAYPEAKKKLS